jgi:integrase
MQSLSTQTIPVNPSGAALVAIEQLLAERGSTAAIRPEDLAEIVARVASTVAAPPELPVGSVSFEDVFVPELMAEYGPRLRSIGTLRAVKRVLKILREMNVTQTSDLTVKLMTRIVSSRNPELSPNTVKSILQTISAICGHAVNFGYLDVNPFQRRPIRTFVRGCKPQGERHLTKAQIVAIHSVLAADVRDRQGWALYRARRLQALVVLISGTGLRRGEALHAHVTDLDLDEGLFWVVSRSTHRLKTAGSEKFVIVAAQAIDILRDWLTHRMDAPEGFEREPSPYLFPNIRSATPWLNGPPGYRPLDRLKAVAKRAGVDGASYQKLRASVATHMEAAGCGPAQIQRQLRHSNQGVTQAHYMQADRANMKKAMENFGY